MISLADQQSLAMETDDATQTTRDGRDNALVLAKTRPAPFTVLTLLGQLQPRRIMELVFPVWIGLRKLWTYES